MSVALHWTTKRAPREHHGARAGEYPRYIIKRERRCGALAWVVYYRPGGLRDVELGSTPESLAEARAAAEEDLMCRIAIGDVPRLEERAS